jgi:SAM-dependent methyltransferase
MQRVVRVPQLVRGPRVLDVGFANNPDGLHAALRERFPDVWGIDRNEEAVRALGLPKTSVADAQDFDLGQTFDTVVAGEVIEHLEDPGRFLAAARRHLAPGGQVVLSTPQPFALINIAYAWKNYPRTCSNPEHTLWLCPQTLGVLAERMDYRVAHWELAESTRDEHPNPRYRWFVKTLGALPLPARMQANCIIAVLEPSPEPAAS